MRTSDELRREIERCEREICQCVDLQRQLAGTPEMFDAAWGEMDWIIAKLGYEEDLEIAIARESAEERVA